METLRAREIFSDVRLSLFAVESVDVQQGKTRSSCHVYGRMAPVAVIVCGPDKAYALDMESKPTSLDRLRQDIPGLNAMIASFG